MPRKIGEVAEKRKKDRQKERKRKAQEELTNLPDNSCFWLKNF
jgi:hypothetical protein